jgi:hypothetical protein
MVLTPCSSDRDGEIVHGVKLQIARTAPDIPIADRRSIIPAQRGTPRVSLERFMMFSVGSSDHGQHRINSSRSAGNIRRRSKCQSCEGEVGTAGITPDQRHSKKGFPSTQLIGAENELLTHMGMLDQLFDVASAFAVVSLVALNRCFWVRRANS